MSHRTELLRDIRHAARRGATPEELRNIMSRGLWHIAAVNRQEVLREAVWAVEEIRAAERPAPTPMETAASQLPSVDAVKSPPCPPAKI